VTTALEESTVTFSCRGHPAIRGTHAKTLELTREPDISVRATCVVGVAAQVGTEELAGFVGPVSITLRTGPHQEVVRATAEPAFRLERAIVLRRSRHRSPDTFATGADRGAGDLDREMIRMLQHPDARLLVVVRGRRSGPAARGARLIVLAPGEPAALEALESADLVVDGNGGRRARVRAPVPLDDAGLERALRALEAGQRVAAVVPGLTRGLWAASQLTAAAAASAVPVDFVGVPEEVRALLVSGLVDERPVTVGRLTGDAPGLASGPGVWWVPGRALGRVLARCGRDRVCVLLDPRRPVETALRGQAEAVRRGLRGRSLPSGEVLLVTASPATPGGWSPETEALLTALLRRGLSVRLLARALADLPGFDRRRAYTTALELRRRLGGAVPEPVSGEGSAPTRPG
jgi:hypothetical protein